MGAIAHCFCWNGLSSFFSIRRAPKAAVSSGHGSPIILPPLGPSTAASAFRRAGTAVQRDELRLPPTASLRSYSCSGFLPLSAAPSLCSAQHAPYPPYGAGCSCALHSQSANRFKPPRCVVVRQQQDAHGAGNAHWPCPCAGWFRVACAPSHLVHVLIFHLHHVHSCTDNISSRSFFPQLPSPNVRRCRSSVDAMQHIQRLGPGVFV